MVFQSSPRIKGRHIGEIEGAATANSPQNGSNIVLMKSECKNDQKWTFSLLNLQGTYILQFCSLYKTIEIRKFSFQEYAPSYDPMVFQLSPMAKRRHIGGIEGAATANSSQNRSNIRLMKSE